MKRVRKFGLLLALGLFLIPAVAIAAQTQADENAITVRTDVTVADDLYALSDTVTVAGTVNGSVIAAAGNITIDGTVTGDVWALAGDVNISGTVGGSVRTGAGSVNVSGKVGGDVLVASGDLTVARSGQIGRDILVASGTAVIDGTIGRHLKITADKLTIGGKIAGNVNANTDLAPQLIDGAAIGGKLTYESHDELNKAPTATVAGAIERTAKESDDGPSIGTRLFEQMYFFTAAVLLLLLWLLVARRAAVVEADLLTKRLGWAALVGFLFIIAAPIALVLLLITFVGIPLAAIGGAVYLVALYVAKIPVSLAIGMAIFRKRRDSFFYVFASGVLGLIVLYVLMALPVIGWVVTLTTIILGIGARLLLVQQVWRDNRKKYGS